MKKKLSLIFFVFYLIYNIYIIPRSEIYAEVSTVVIEESDDDDNDDVMGSELSKYDISISPVRKTLKKGKSFVIRIILINDFYNDLEFEETQDLLNKSIDYITFRSTKNKVAKVGRRTGKVTGMKKGTSSIKTTVFLSNGESVSFKTKVYVSE